MRAQVAGTELHYEDRGRGFPVLFLHAFPLGLFMWDDQVAALETRRRLVRFDARGFGGTPVGDGPLTMDRIADDAVALLDHLGVETAVVAGCSMGGYAAFAMVRRHPRRIRALVLQNTRATADTYEARKNRGVLAERVLTEGAGVAADAFLPKLLGETTHRDRSERETRLRERILENPPRGIADALLGLGARADSVPTLGAVSVPTLVIVGDEDTLTPPSDAETMHAGIRGSRLETIRGAGHLSNLENPEDYNRILGAFLDDVARLP
jgi:pimeloyl-ACP methyl ester carboxylesterase